jgi:hypothetical protein
VDFVYAVAMYLLSLAMTFLDDGAGAEADRALPAPSATASE